MFPLGKINMPLVGKDAPVIAKAAGFTVPDDTEVLAVKVTGIAEEDPLNQEKMSVVLCLKSYDTFENGVDIAVKNLVYNGMGHTGAVFSHNMENVKYAGERLPVARLLVNQSTTDAWGPPHNGLSPAVSEGCGTWGNNILCGNVDYIHLLNVIKVAMKMDVETPDHADSFK